MRGHARRLLAPLPLAVLAVFLLAAVWVVRRESRAPVQRTAGESAVGRLHTVYSGGRSGAFFLPQGYRDRPLPLLTLLHGTGGSGAGVISLVEDAAVGRGFAVVAPDSESPSHWDVPDHPGETTTDSEHVIACVREVMGMEHVVIDRERVLIVGISGGGSTAPYEASAYDEFTAFAVLHGGAFPAGFGARRVRGWFSTGLQDSLRPVAMVSKAVDAVRAVGFQDITFNVYAGGHEVSPVELQALLDWWLAP